MIRPRRIHDAQPRITKGKNMPRSTTTPPPVPTPSSDPPAPPSEVIEDLVDERGEAFALTYVSALKPLMSTKSYVACCLYTAIATHATATQRAAWPSQSRLAEMLGTTQQSVSRALKKLSQAGLVEVRSWSDKNGHRHNTYVLTKPGVKPK